MAIDPIEELMLRAYPNPERKGCPGEDIIRKLGNDQVGHNDPLWQHLWKCSPCFSEFRIVRDKRRARERRRRLSVIGAAAAVLCIGIGLLLFWRTSNFQKQEAGGRPPHVSVSYPAAILNLGMDTRRSGRDQENIEIQRLPRRQVELTVYLPGGSEEGKYELQLVDGQANILVTSSGTAEINRGLTRFSTIIDLSKIPIGSYTIKSRRLPDGAWRSANVELSNQ